MAGEDVVGADKPYNHRLSDFYSALMILSDERGELDADPAPPLNSFDSLSDGNKTVWAPFLF